MIVDNRYVNVQYLISMEDYWPYSVHTTESTEITDNVYLSPCLLLILRLSLTNNYASSRVRENLNYIDTT